MAQLNYLNPASIAPDIGWKPVGATAGMLHNERQQDYNELMKNQMLLQNIGARQAAIGLHEDMKDIPLKDLVREGKIETERAKQPFLADLARSGAERDINKNRFEAVEKGPKGIERLLRTWDDEKDNVAWTKRTREATIARDILERALSYSNPEEGSAYVNSEIEKYNKLGYNLPSWLSQPDKWKPIHQGLVQTIEHRQKKDLVETKEVADIIKQREADAAALERAKVYAGSRVDSARVRGTGGGAAQYRLEAQLDKFGELLRAGAPQAEIDEQESIVQALLRAKAESNLLRDDTFFNEYQRAKTPQEKESVRERHIERQSRRIIDEFKRGVGRSQGSPSPSPTPSPANAGLNPQQQDWFNRAKQANPNMSDHEIVQEGRRLGKLP